MEFFLTLVLVYPPDFERQHRFSYQYGSMQDCNEARKAWVGADTGPTQPRALSAVCASGRPPPPSAFQQQEDQAMLDGLKRALKVLEK
jgi:hypothetical protein